MSEKLMSETNYPIKGVIIAKESGLPLVSVINDKRINTTLISAFISALQFFYKENLGNIDEILVKGLVLHLYIVAKYGLIIIAMMDTNTKKVNIRGEAEEALDGFYYMFKDKLESDVVHKNTFKPFEEIYVNKLKIMYIKFLTMERVSLKN